MTIVESKQKKGKLTLGGTATQDPQTGAWTVTGGTSFACQATNVRVTPNYDDSGDPVETLCGDALGTAKTETWQLNGTAIQDFTDPAGFLAYCFTNRMLNEAFTWQANDTAPLWAGNVTVLALEEGGDVNVRLTTDFTFDIVGTPTRGRAAGTVPTVTTVAPASGAAAGGTAVTITGTNLTGATGVTFGGTAGTAFSVTSATEVKATSPAHAAGAVDVTVKHPSGDASKTGGFTYS